MDHLGVPQFLGLLVAIFAAAKLLGALAQWIGQPAVLGELHCRFIEKLQRGLELPQPPAQFPGQVAHDRPFFVCDLPDQERSFQVPRCLLLVARRTLWRLLQLGRPGSRQVELRHLQRTGPPAPRVAERGSLILHIAAVTVSIQRRQAPCQHPLLHLVIGLLGVEAAAVPGEAAVGADVHQQRERVQSDRPGTQVGPAAGEGIRTWLLGLEALVADPTVESNSERGTHQRLCQNPFEWAVILLRWL